MATNTKVRGITIELGADTSKLVADLKSANTTISKTQKELRDVDKLLKFNPGNITLIKQRTQALQTQIGNTKNKLEELKKAEQTMKSKGVDENSEQFRALQREIIETESKLKELNNTAGSGSATLYAISEKTGAIGESATKAGKKLMPLTAGIAAIGTVAVKTTSDFDSAMSQVAAISGSTGEDFDKLRDKAREMGSKTKFSASEAADAMTYMAMAGWKTEDMLSGVEGIMNLAAASGEDLATTSDIVTDALTAFGMSAEDSGRFADILAAASSNANTNVSMLGESFKYVAPLAGAMGYSAEDTSLALALMANSGVKASSAGTALRSIMTRLAKPTDEVSGAMEALGISLDDGQGNMKSFREVMRDLRSGFKGMKRPSDEVLKNLENLDKSLEAGEITQDLYEKSVESLTKELFGAEGAMKAEAAAALAGKQGLSGLLAIVNASDEDFEKLAESIDGSSGSAQKMADKMQDNLGGQLQILKSQLQELAISFGDLLMPVIRKVVEKIQTFIDKLNGMSAGTKRTIAVIAGIAAAVAPALLVFGKLATAISAITKVMSTMKFTKFLTSPITLAIAAVAGLVAGLVTLFKKLEANNSTLSAWSDELEASRKKNEELKSSLESTASEYDKSTTEAEKNAGAAEGLKKKLNELMAVEEKSEAQKEQIRQIVEELNEIVPNLGLAYKEEADKLNLSNEQIQRNIDLRKEQARVTASSEAYQKTIADVTEAEIALDDAEKTFNEMLSSMSEDRKAAWEEYQKKGELAFDLFDRITYIDDMKKLEEAERNVADAQSNLNGLVEKSEKYWDKWQESNEALTEKQGELQKEINKTDLKGFREELGRTFGKDLPASLNKAVNHAKTYGVEIPEELKQGILDGSTSVEDAVEQINKLVNVELAKAPQEATKTGAQIPTNQASAMQGKKGLVKEAALNLVKDSSLKQAETNATTSGSNTGINFGTSLGAKQGFVTAKANGVVGATNSALKKTDGKTPATNAMNQYGSSIWSNRALAINNAGKVASGTGSALGKTGASKQGKEVPTLFSAGILGGVYKAYNAAWKLAGNANSGAKDNNYGKTRGQEFAQGYVNGINGMLSLSYSTGFALAQQALLGTADGQKSKSPSKLAMGLGNDFGEGYEIGLNDYLKKIFVSAKGLAASALSGAGDYSALTANRMSAVTAGGQIMPAQSVVNYTQNNYSPKALSTSDIYRQSKNLLNLKVEA